MLIVGRLAAPGRAAAEAVYRVGVARDHDPYVGAWRALEAAGDWPARAIRDRRVLIKPNLVHPVDPEGGATTHPEAVRCLVDASLASGAAEVWICESGRAEAKFAACGYDLFSEYGSGKVRLVDLETLPHELASVPGGGWAYQKMRVPSCVLEESPFLISAGKLKTHANTTVTLTQKNLVGLLPERAYRSWRAPWLEGRFAIHERGVFPTVVDLARLCPIDYALVEGVWGMEGNGPTDGTPRDADLLVAGRNPVAVDRVCAQAMGFGEGEVQHLRYASALGMGPAGTDEIRLGGDPVPGDAFVRADSGPEVELPRVFPATRPWGHPLRRLLLYVLNQPCEVRLALIQIWETHFQVREIRDLRDWTLEEKGLHALSFEPVGEDGAPLPGGAYAVWLRARFPGGLGREVKLIGPFWVT